MTLCKVMESVGLLEHAAAILRSFQIFANISSWWPWMSNRKVTHDNCVDMSYAS